MADKEAKIRLGVEGASEAKSNVTRVQAAFEGLKQTLHNVQRLGVDTARAITDIRPFDPKRAVRNAEETRLAVQRMAVDAGTSVEALTRRFEGIGEKLGLNVNEVTELTGALSNMTKESPTSSADALEALGVAANNSNRSLREMLEVGAALHNDLRVPLAGVGRELQFLNRVAGEVGTQGGGKGLQGMMTALSRDMRDFDVSTEGARRRLEAFTAMAGGKLPHEQAIRSAGSVLGAVADNAQGIGRYLGRDIHNANGEIDVGALFELRAKIARTRDPKARIRVLTHLFGDRKTALIFQAIKDMGAVEDLVTGSAEAATARRHGLGGGVAAYELDKLTDAQRKRAEEDALGDADRFTQTAAGEGLRLDVERQNAERHVGDQLLKAKDFHRRQYKGDAAGRVAHDTALSVMPDLVQDVVNAVDAGAAMSNRNLPAAPEGKTGRDIQMERLLQETQRTNQLLQKQPQAIGEHVRSDPNKLGVDRAAARPAN